MKNKVLFALLICLGSFTTGWSQALPNNGFETWVTDTNYLVLTLVTPTLYDTSVSASPANWTSSNALTNTNTFHHKTLVSQSGTVYAGSSAIQLRSDSISALITGVPGVGSLPLSFVCPGFVVCGNFPINFTALTNIVTSGSVFNPALLPGAGVPVSGRVAKIGGYLKFTPVGGDSAYVVAVLRKGSTVVATATYTRNTTDASYSYFEAPFVYQNCLEPDTLVYTLSSGNPYSINNVIGFSPTPTGQHIGSTLLADGLVLIDTTAGYGVVFPANDTAHTTRNTAVTIPVTTNDTACTGGVFTVSTGTNPAHGTISVSGDSIVYTPTAGYTGNDTFTYTVSIGGGQTGTAQVVVKVNPPLGINEATDGKTSIYPNPASNKLYVSTANTSVSELHIYDMLGKLMKSENFYANTAVDLTNFNNGIYIIQFSGNDGKMISSSRFIVVK